MNSQEGSLKDFNGASSVQSELKKNDDIICVKLNIEIIDQGMGISSEGIKNLFVDFSKLKEN